ncbi:MAG: M48 family metallopeptidase [Chryseobacterium jejuense]|uniref:M48 family metallopeptidase n=1 Tax=Chryseobacterium jejuense TaxID=445960 RepID=UPI003D0B0425
MKLSELEIELIRCKRKTVSIHIERDGTVSARIPENITEDEIRKVLQSKEYQIHKNLAQWFQLNQNKVDREYVNGQSFLYLGRNYRLQIIENQLDSIIFKKGYFYLSISDKANARELFINFYKEKLAEKLKPIIQKYKHELGVEPSEIKIMELQNRWASCTTKRNLYFHWKCAMAPIDVLHYIVAHELTHLIHSNHTSAFWNELDKIIPNYQKQLHWLKINGASMDL